MLQNNDVFNLFFKKRIAAPTTIALAFMFLWDWRPNPTTFSSFRKEFSDVRYWELFWYLAKPYNVTFPTSALDGSKLTFSSTQQPAGDFAFNAISFTGSGGINIQISDSTQTQAGGRFTINPQRIDLLAVLGGNANSYKLPGWYVIPQGNSLIISVDSLLGPGFPINEFITFHGRIVERKEFDRDFFPK